VTFWGNQDFFFEIAQGNVEGMKMYAIPGRRDNVSANGLADISQIPSTAAIFVVPSPGGQQLEVVSSSTADDVLGTGVQTLEIEFLDSNGAEQSEILSMDGTTPVATSSTDIDKVQWMHGVTVGDNTVSVGNITLRSTVGGETFEYIAAGGNQSLSARYTVPTGKTGYILGWQASAITKVIDFRLRATVDRFTRVVHEAFNFQDSVILDTAPSGWIPFVVPLKCPETAEIKISGVSAAAGGDAGGEFDVLLVDDGAKIDPRTTRLR
jgi:hypothetical protein